MKPVVRDTQRYFHELTAGLGAEAYLDLLEELLSVLEYERAVLSDEVAELSAPTE